MRKKAIVVVLIALVAALTFSITGQEEPLPVVRIRTTQPAFEVAAQLPTVFLEEGPTTPPRVLTLAEAARENDFLSFDALYTAARDRGESVAAFENLHELWSWSMSDPIGAFYGQEMHDRIASAYPGFTQYIGEYLIVDRRGNAFYPTSETRAFLLDRASEGTSPTVMIAEPILEDAGTPSAITEPAPAIAVRADIPAAVAPVSVRESVRESVPASSPVSAPVPALVDVAPQTLEQETTVFETSEPAIVVDATQPAVSPVVTPAPINAAPVSAQTPASTRLAFENRGLYLLVIGLLGVTLLAVILRGPREKSRPAVSVPIETFRRTPMPGTLKTTEEQPKSRATGSHG